MDGWDGAFGGVVGRYRFESQAWWPPERRPAADAPNVVMVVLDDVGFAQLGCFGSDIETPTFDGLAEHGLRYANFHTTALCSPTRACLLTGRNHHSNGMGRIADAFNGCIDELTHDPRFGDIEFVSHCARRANGAAAPVVTIDRAGGMDLAACERVSAAVNAQLEQCGEPYTLHVQSAGTDRALTKPGDYQRFAGRRAKIVTSLSINGGKTHRGTLCGVRGTNVMLETGAGALPLPLTIIKTANLEYDVRDDLRRDKKERKQHA